jgi:TatD DNase family protein
LEEHLRHFEPECPYANKLWFSIGIHPHDAANWDRAAEETVRHFATHSKCVGIGECGVDFFKHDLREKEIQLRAFRAQASLSVELNKALVIHARLVTKANEDMFLQEMEQVLPADHRIHIHCFSDSLAHAMDLCKRWPNLRIGFSGAITFRDRGKGKGKGKAVNKGQDEEKKGEEHCRELVQGIPLERLLIETDGPYMCPEPFRGQTAHPGHVHRIAERIAEWKGVALGLVMNATRASTAAVYCI